MRSSCRHDPSWVPNLRTPCSPLARHLTVNQRPPSDNASSVPSQACLSRAPDQTSPGMFRPLLLPPAPPPWGPHLIAPKPDLRNHSCRVFAVAFCFRSPKLTFRCFPNAPGFTFSDICARRAPNMGHHFPLPVVGKLLFFWQSLSPTALLPLPALRSPGQELAHTGSGEETTDNGRA